MICILEDNADRIEQFRQEALRIAPNLRVRFWRSAHVMISDLIDTLPEATLISLDHDLNELPGDQTDPGCGYDVARLLGELIPCCPIIIHTSNSERGTWMEGELTRAGWLYRRVYPFGDDWIANQWALAVRELLEIQL